MAFIRILFLLLFVNAGSDHSTIRQCYLKINQNEQQVLNILYICSKSTELHPAIKMGYMGAAKMCQAQFSYNPVTKLKMFREGQMLLEAAILADPLLTELRLLRYTVQNNAPGFLNYKGQIETDRSILKAKKEQIRTEDPDLYRMMSTYFFSEKQKSTSGNTF